MGNTGLGFLCKRQRVVLTGRILKCYYGAAAAAALAAYTHLMQQVQTPLGFLGELSVDV